MIIIIFISLAVVYFFIQYFENKRRQKNEAYHERKREAFTNLLQTLKEKEKNDQLKKDTEHDS